MNEFILLAEQMPLALKVAWALLLVWGLVQIGWFRSARTTIPAWEMAPPRRAMPRRPVVATSARSKPASTATPGAEAVETSLPFEEPVPHSDNSGTDPQGAA
jgi:hypothetical protein